MYFVTPTNRVFDLQDKFVPTGFVLIYCRIIM